MKIEQKSNYGNFDYSISAEIGDDVNAGTQALCKQGLANIAYRVCGSSVDKALGVKDRKALGYTSELGNQIDVAVNKKLVELEGKDAALKSLGITFHVTGQHEFGAEGGVSSRVIATAVWTQMQSLPDAQFAVARMIYGVPEEYTDESAIEAVHAFNQKSKKKPEPAKESPAAQEEKAGDSAQVPAEGEASPAK